MQVTVSDTIAALIAAIRVGIEIREAGPGEFFDDPRSEYTVSGIMARLKESVNRLKAMGWSGDIDTASVSKMRDKLLHHYEAIDLDIAWATLAMDFEPLLDKALRVQAEYDSWRKDHDELVIPPEVLNQ